MSASTVEMDRMMRPTGESQQLVAYEDGGLVLVLVQGVLPPFP